MNKLCFVLPALLLAACSPRAAVQPVTPALVQETAPPPPPPVETVATPVTIELSNSYKIQAVSCKDDLDCFQKLTGLCPNGYTNARQLMAENQRRVAITFHCVTDTEKAEAAAEQVRRDAEQEAWEAQRAAELQKRQEELKNKSPAKKSSK